MTSNAKLPSWGIPGTGMCFGDTTLEFVLSACLEVLKNRKPRTDCSQTSIIYIYTHTHTHISGKDNIFITCSWITHCSWKHGMVCEKIKDKPSCLVTCIVAMSKLPNLNNKHYYYYYFHHHHYHLRHCHHDSTRIHHSTNTAFNNIRGWSQKKCTERNTYRIEHQMCGKVLQFISVVPLLLNYCIPMFGRSMIPVRSVEQLSCLTRRVMEADRSSSIEKHTPHMLIFNFGNRSKSGGLMSGL